MRIHPVETTTIVRDKNTKTLTVRMVGSGVFIWNVVVVVVVVVAVAVMVVVVVVGVVVVVVVVVLPRLNKRETRVICISPLFGSDTFFFFGY